MLKNLLNKIAVLLVIIGTMNSCDMPLQKNYDYESSVLDPHVNMTAWEYINSRPDIFSTYIEAIEYTGMKDYFTQTDTEYTFLALNNTAMKNFMADRFPGISSISDCDMESVKKLLQYHIIEGSYSCLWRFARRSNPCSYFAKRRRRSYDYPGTEKSMASRCG